MHSSAAPSLETSQVEANETTALLAPSLVNGEAVLQDKRADPECLNGHGDNADDKPLPLAQIFLLCYSRVIDPICYFAIFPFINQMIMETGDVAEIDVGFYSGIIESLFSATQMLLMIFWGRASDRYGRKPILVLSLAGLSVTASLFGTSRTVWQMIVFRCLAGIFAGTLVTVRTMITESSTPKTQAKAFSYFSFSGNVGIFLGPLLGGGLSKPAEQYPKVFGSIQFLKDFPYSLPTFACGALGASMVVLNILFLKETLNQRGGEESSGSRPMSVSELVRCPGVARVLYINGHVSLLSLAYTAVLPVFLFSDPKLGGFGFSPLRISAFLGIAAVSQAMWLLVVFPPLQRRIGTMGVMRKCSIVLPLVYCAYPICNTLLRMHWDTAFWVIAPSSLVIGSGASMLITAVQLALNDAAPSPSTLGTLNAVCLTIMSGMRMVAPATFSSIFAAGVKTQFLGGHLAWLVLILFAIPLIVLLRRFPAKMEGKLDHARAGNDE